MPIRGSCPCARWDKVHSHQPAHKSLPALLESRLLLGHAERRSDISPRGYASYLNNKPRTGIWYNSEGNDPRSVAFHSDNPSLESTKFRHRTWLSGNLRDDDCSLVIDNVMQGDAGPYFFRVEFTGSDRFNYLPVTQLHVKALTHHEQNLTCRVTYPTVSSEQNLILTVQYAPRNLSITSPNNVNNSVAKEGNSAAFLCSIHSNPASNLTWRHLNDTLNTTRSSNELWMKILGVTRKDAGDYQCVAENEHGTAEESVTLIVECE
ncbi:sialic acid-binding Ig-like lectin 10 [Amblyraja radiata]|uniref:sialic acid-binding Ig-like lectin 10 n=1 Tax=Amblyraja radiata TaxID=386614 RepID=UPI00140311FC|nr:sialic acid-binding Ig-like lectin 10 [Amblyraja radiata]